MLKNIPSIISPEMIKVLMEMGHGDEIVLSDGNFPSSSMSQRLVRSDGHGIPEILDAVMEFFPLDSYVEFPVILMKVTKGDSVKTPIWDEYYAIINRHESRHVQFEHMERFAFYERAKKAYAVIASGEKALYANIILKKGVVTG